MSPLLPGIGAATGPRRQSDQCRVVGRQREVGHTDDVRRRTITEIIVGGNPHAVSRPDLGAIGDNDAGCDPLPARHAGGDEAPVAARGAKQIMHRVDDRGGDLRVGETVPRDSGALRSAVSQRSGSQLFSLAVSAELGSESNRGDRLRPRRPTVGDDFCLRLVFRRCRTPDGGRRHGLR